MADAIELDGTWKEIVTVTNWTVLQATKKAFRVYSGNVAPLNTDAGIEGTDFSFSDLDSRKLWARTDNITENIIVLPQA
jgi:hypothetical protein